MTGMTISRRGFAMGLSISLSMGLAALVKQIVLSEPFRNRRGEPE